ncbi:hypothetical protein GF359_09430 [candidate division WOR-3 bacterium]|uniref:Uncharacterized protein n=1 Tax=candidate division WOR-3 bacterium TaxID=2052148 RepID=A0A9D5KB17_UNCW3|nr:hypothetical protein [candidate division WOR-3 bacterium]MBD3365420.1 hypothetical protein [candidate division WOR-3 bacterium]
MGAHAPSRCAVRNIGESGPIAMKADLLYKHCISYNSPGVPVKLGSNNQRCVRYFTDDFDTRIMMVYTLYGRVTFRTMLKGADATLYLSDLVDAKPHLSLSNSGASYPALQYYNSDNTVHLCWLEDEAPDYELWYRRGVLSSTEPDEADWTGPLNARANIGALAGYGNAGSAHFTPPAIEIHGGTVFIATGIYRNTALDYGGGQPINDSLPVLCFRFPLGNPSDVEVDTIGWYDVLAVQGDVGGATVSLARD